MEQCIRLLKNVENSTCDTHIEPFFGKEKKNERKEQLIKKKENRKKTNLSACL